MSRILHTFEEYHFAFEFYHNVKLCITCYYHDEHIFTIYDNAIIICNFSNTMQFFELSILPNDIHEIKLRSSSAFVCLFNKIDELTHHVITNKLKKVIDTFELKENIYDAIKKYLPETDSIKLVFVD
jgi:hypothetical protein